MSAHLTVAAPPLQILREQSSISHLSILGRGELDFRGVPGSRAFELGLVHFLTSLRLKTDWGASIFIPATMQLQSLELYAPALHLSAEEEAWPQGLTDLCIMTAELLYDTHSGLSRLCLCAGGGLTCLCMLTCSTAPTILALLRPALMFTRFRYTTHPHSALQLYAFHVCYQCSPGSLRSCLSRS